jgi:hypothetical protein
MPGAGGQAGSLGSCGGNRQKVETGDDKEVRRTLNRLGTGVMILKIFSPKNLAKILAFFCSNYC